MTYCIIKALQEFDFQVFNRLGNKHVSVKGFLKIPLALVIFKINVKVLEMILLDFSAFNAFTPKLFRKMALKIINFKSSGPDCSFYMV